MNIKQALPVCGDSIKTDENNEESDSALAPVAYPISDI